MGPKLKKIFNIKKAVGSLSALVYKLKTMKLIIFVCVFRWQAKSITKEYGYEKMFLALVFRFV
jgi:hypothetical protein